MKYLIGFLILFCGLITEARVQNISLIYNGPGSCEGCPEAIGRLLREMGMKIRYIGPTELTQTIFKTATLYVQPGGTGDSSVDTLKALHSSQIKMLQDFVSAGGRYLGICAGGYLAGQFWDSNKKLKAFGLLPITVESELDDISPQLISVFWRGKEHKMYFQYGPSFNARSIPGAELWAAYKGSGRVAALMTSFGNGRVGVIGPHPEATREWYLQDGLNMDDGLKLNLAKDFIRALLK